MDQFGNWWLLLQAMATSSAGRVALAALLGGIIGIEREWRGRPAGFRTNIMIAIGSCLFTILSVEGFPLGGSSAQDTARVAAQIVSGVGFLGAGALLQRQGETKGMTTAATIWLVAAIGMAVGTHSYFLAIFTTVLATAVLQLLLPVSRLVEKEAHSHEDKKKQKEHP